VPVPVTVAVADPPTDAAPPFSSSSPSASPCPDDMIYVDTSYCGDIERTCLEYEWDAPNNLVICHRFAPAQRCKTQEEHRRFCIDTYEYPNREGAHPVWMLTWYQAQATCESKGKRLCYASEWTAACEGPKELPFPYGIARDHTQCNIDNIYIEMKKDFGRWNLYSKDGAVVFKELSRLDQSVPSGKLASCISGFGVHDMTGNVDEWVTSDEPPREKSKWAGLKGGGWGHVRNACRPMTTSHDPGFWYYSVGFRCCSDPAGGGAWRPNTGGAGDPDAAPAVEAHDFAPDPVVSERPPGPSRMKYLRWNVASAR
jgi:hypothetical protein